MFVNPAFVLKTILFWSLVTVTLVECERQKKDVHHMIFLNESRRPTKSHRHKDQEHHQENRPKKSRKKPGGKKHKEPATLDDSVEETSYEEFFRPKPKSKRHQHKQTRRPVRNHKRHNPQRPHNEHKHHKYNQHHHNHHENYKPKESPTFPASNWIPLSSNELIANEHQQFLRGNGLGHHHLQSGYMQPVPMEITTPLPLPPINPYDFKSTIYPPLSPSINEYLNQKVENNPQHPLIGTVEPYKPFDYSILEQKPQDLNPSGTYQGQEASSSNIVNVKHSGGKNGKPFSIVVENSRENAENSGKKKEEKETKSEGDGEKHEKTKGKGKRVRGGSRFRIRTKN